MRVRIANGGLEADDLYVPVPHGSLRIETLRLGLARVHVRGVRVRCELKGTTRGGTGVAAVLRRLAARHVRWTLEGPVDVSIGAGGVELTARAAACRLAGGALRADAVEVACGGAVATVQGLVASGDGASVAALKVHVPEDAVGRLRTLAAVLTPPPAAPERPWAALALVAALCAWWPLLGLAVVALWALGTYVPSQSSGPYELGAASVALTFGRLGASATKLRWHGAALSADDITVRLRHQEDEVLCARATAVTSQSFRVACETLRATVDPRAFFRASTPARGSWRAELVVTRAVEAVFVKQDTDETVVRRASLKAGASAATVAPGAIRATLGELYLEDGAGRAFVEGGALEFQRRAASETPAAFSLKLVGGDVFYEHRFVADVLRWVGAARAPGDARGAPRLDVECSRIRLVVPESHLRRGSAVFDVTALKAARPGSLTTNEPISVEVDCALQYLDKVCAQLPKLCIQIVRTDIHVHLGPEFALDLTRAQYACLVGLFFGNVGHDGGDNSSGKWWPERDVLDQVFPPAWCHQGTAPHALSALGFNWRIHVTCPAVAIHLVDCGCTLEAERLDLDVDRVAQGGGCASALALGTLRVARAEAPWLLVRKRRGVALRYEHRTNVAFTWAGVWLGPVDVTTRPAHLASLVDCLWGGFKRASRLAPPKRADVLSPRRRTHTASLVVDAQSASYVLGDLICTLGPVRFAREASLAAAQASLDAHVASVTSNDRTLARSFEVRWSRRASYDRDAVTAEAHLDLGHVDLYGNMDDGKRCRAVWDVIRRPASPPVRDAHAWTQLVESADPPRTAGRTSFSGSGSLKLHVLRRGGRRRIARGSLRWTAAGASDAERMACNVDVTVEAAAKPEKAWAPVLDRHALVIALESRHGGRARSCRVVSAEPLHASLDVKLMDALKRDAAGPEKCCALVCRHRIASSTSLDAFLRIQSGDDFGGTVAVQSGGARTVSGGEDSGCSDDEAEDAPRVVIDALTVHTEEGPWVLHSQDYGGAAPLLLAGASTPLRLRRDEDVALVRATCARAGPRLVLTLASRFTITNQHDEPLAIRCGGFAATVEPGATQALPLVPETAPLEAKRDNTWVDCGRVGAGNALKRIGGGLCRGGRDETIVLRPVLRLKNALPCALAWELALKARGVRRGCLHASEGIALPTAVEKATLRLRVANYVWSRGVSLDIPLLTEASATTEGVVSRTELVLDALDARVESTEGDAWVRVAPSLRVAVDVDSSGRITVKCRYALENLLEAPCTWAPAEIHNETQRILAVQQLGLATTNARRPSLVPGSRRRRGLSSVRSVSDLVDLKVDAPRVAVTVRLAAHQERRVALVAATAGEAVRLAVATHRDEYDVVDGDGRAVDLDAPLRSDAPLILRHRLERALAQQDALDRDQVYPSEAAAAAAVAVPWAGALPWDPVKGGPRRHGPHLAVRAALTHGPPLQRGEATARVRLDGCSEWSAPLVLPTQRGPRLEGTALRFEDDDVEAADGAACRLQLRAPERNAQRAVYDVGVRVEPGPHYVGVVLAPQLSFRNETDGVLEVRQAGVDVDRPLLELQPKETGQVVAWSCGDGPRLVQLRCKFQDDAILKSGALRADCLTGRGETVFSVSGGDAVVNLRLRREARDLVNDDGSNRAGACLETLCIVEPADARWPPYRVVNRTDAILRYRQRLAKVNYPREVADFDGELTPAPPTDFVLATLNHASKPVMRELVVQPRDNNKRHGLKVTGNDDEAPDDEVGGAQKFQRAPSMSSELEKAATSMMTSASSSVFGSTSKPPTSASDALERAANYVGKKARSGARKVGLLEARATQQRVGTWRILGAGESHAYAWERPLDAVGSSTRSQRRVLIVEACDAQGAWTRRAQAALDEAQGELRGDVPCRVMADGPTRVLEIGRSAPESHRPELVGGEDGGNRLVVHAAEIGASILIRGLDDAPRELVKITLCDARAAWTCLEQGGVNAEFSIQHVQVDNLLSPRPLYAAALRPRLDDDDAPCLAASVRRRTDADLSTAQHAVTYLDRFVVRARPLDVHLDHEVAALLVALYADCSRDQEDPGTKGPALLRAEAQGRRQREASRLAAQHRRPAVFCAQVRLHPVDARVTLKGGLTPLTRKEVARACGITSVDAVSAAVGQLDTASLRVDALYLDDALARTAEGLGRRVARHYLQTLLKQAHRVCGSLDIVRAPMSAASSLGGGVLDLVYQPVQGASTGGASGLASGVARGSASAVGGAFDAATGVVSSVTASTGSALAALTMDASYQTSRATRRAQEANQNKSQGTSTSLADSVQRHSKVAAEMVRGAQDLGGGIFDGVTGIVVEPYKSVCRGDDALDVAKATARGLVGVAIKPAVGVVDMTTRAVEGVRTAGRYANDSFQSAVLPSMAKKLKRRSSLSDAPWRRRARLDPHCPWSRLSHARVVKDGPRFKTLDAEAAEAQQCLRLVADGDERLEACLEYGAALDDVGDVRWFGKRTHFIGQGSDAEDEDAPSAPCSTPTGARRRRARTRVCRRWVLAASEQLQYVRDDADTDDRRPRVVWEAPLGDVVGVESGSDDDDDLRVVFGVPPDETPRKWCKRHIPDARARVSCVVGLEISHALRDGAASLPRRAAPNRALVCDGVLYIANPQKGAKRSRRRLVLRGGCLYAYRDVDKSLGGRDTPELSRAVVLRDTFVDRASRAPPPALRPDECQRALVLAPTEGPKLRAVRVRAASGAYLTAVLPDADAQSVCLLFESVAEAAAWLEALRRAAAPVSSPPPGDVVSLPVDCAGVSRADRALLAARLRKGL